MSRLAPALLLASALGGCSLAPRYVQPELPVPTSWPVGDVYLRQQEVALPAVSYRDIFRDARLQRLIEQALVNNRDLRIAAANIAVARAQYRIQRAELFPEVTASGNYRYSDGGNGSRLSSTTTGGSTGTGTGTGTGIGTGADGNVGAGNGAGAGGNAGIGNGSGSTGITTATSDSNSTFSAQLGVTAFELDLFGRIRSLNAAALARYFGQEAAARATRLSLVGDIASAWLTYASDRSLLLIAQQTAASAEQSVRLTRARLEGGIAPRTDLRQAEQVLETARSDAAAQTTAVAQDLNALQLLVGAPIDAALLPATIEEASANILPLPAGIDSRVLLRRPDVVQAEYELRASNAEIGAARAELFPRISLTGLVGFASTALTDLFKGGSFSYSVAPNVNYPIFRAGAGRAGVAQTQAQRDAALATYERTIQVAFQEVSDALARRDTIAEQLRASTANAAAAEDTARLETARYRGGISTYLNSLDAQRSLYTAQRTLVSTRLVAASNLVTLYRTLGGDQLLEVGANGPQLATPQQ